jgi:hypothetical protein
MHAVILERNKLVGRKVGRLFMATGATALCLEDPAQVAGSLTNADVLCADAFDADLVAELLRANPRMKGVLWTAEPLRRALKYMMECPSINNVLGRKDFESPPRAWEIVMIARRLSGQAAAHPPLAAFLDWGYTSVELDVRTTADRDTAVTRIQELVGGLQVPKRVAEMFAELTHEMIMNAMYDAPADANGRPKYAGDRKANVALEPHERPHVGLGTDGSRLVLQVRDPFGRLERRHVVDGLARGLAGGEMDQSHGGGGLGMMVCHNASSMMVFDVAKGRHTEVTAMFELDMNLREFRTQAKSLHYWSH